MAASGECPVSENERGAVGQGGDETGVYRVLALVVGAGGAECAEGGGVAAALGGEVAAKAEHVCPGGQAEVVEFGQLAEAEAFADEAAGVVANREVGEPVGVGDAAVEGAGAFGGFRAQLESRSSGGMSGSSGVVGGWRL